MAKGSQFARTVVSLVFLILCVHAECDGQNASPSFSAVISCPKATLPSGSFLRIDITLKSRSSDQVLVEGIRTSPEAAGIVVWGPTGEILEPFENAKEKLDSVGSRFATAIPPGKSVTESINASRWFDLRSTGQYVFQVRKRDPISKTVVESNKLTITVIP